MVKGEKYFNTTKLSYLIKKFGYRIKSANISNKERGSNMKLGRTTYKYAYIISVSL